MTEALKALLKVEMDDLPKPMNIILKRFYYDKETMEEIGEALEITKQAVWYWHKKGIDTLKRRMGCYITL
jgi:DNA-directed RNA polymerase specialized sigma subunit